MSILWTSLFVTLFGSLEAHQNSTDIGRHLGIRQTALHTNSEFFYHNPLLFNTNEIQENNDYNDHSSGLNGPSTAAYFQYTAPSVTNAKTPVKIYKPREDPRLFYQSDEYLKEISSNDLNHEIAYIYPGREVVRNRDERMMRTLPARRRSREDNRIDFPDLKQCVRCPRDRTFIAKKGYDRVIFQIPRLILCSGHKAPKNIRFIQIYGPKFGSLLREGSYGVVGRIVNLNENLQICKFQVHVLIQSCHVPLSLIAQCKGHDQPCNFTCRDSEKELHGLHSLRCGEDLQWEDNLPICRIRKWCKSPSPPEHGRISCTGKPAGKDLEGLSEGSRCRVRCLHGWRSNAKALSVCRRGVWTQALTCQIKQGIANKFNKYTYIKEMLLS